MTLDELIAELQQVRWTKKAGRFPVVMNTQSGSGEIARVVVEFDMLENRNEVWLQEVP